MKNILKSAALMVLAWSVITGELCSKVVDEQLMEAAYS
jgi:hypothetical protein